MRRVLETLGEDLRWFVEQREEFALVLDATDHEIPYVLKVLQVVEGELFGDLFVNFAHPLEELDSYMDALMANMNAQISGVNALRAEDSLDPWPALPPECTQATCPPSDRIKALVKYVRAQMPEGDHHLVLGLLPAAIADRAAYSRIVGGLLPKQGIEPWMTNVRLILRDDRDQAFLVPYLDGLQPDRVLIYDRLDLSANAMTQALEDDAMDPTIDEGERMTALVQLAALDFSHRRYGESYRKWGVLFAYYHQHESKPMQALCLCGAADVLRAMGRLEDAKARYQSGLALSDALETLPATLNLLVGVGETCILLEHWEEAEGYLALADQVASKTSLVFPKCDIMERHALTLLALGRTDEAAKKWRSTVDLSREMQHFTRAESALSRLISLFEAAKMPLEVKRHRDELAEVQAEQRESQASKKEDSA